MGSSPIWGDLQQSGAAEACWAHNPEVDGSKPSSANGQSFLSGRLHVVSILSIHANIAMVSNKRATSALREDSHPFAAVVDTIGMLEAAVAGP